MVVELNGGGELAERLCLKGWTSRGISQLDSQSCLGESTDALETSQQNTVALESRLVLAISILNYRKSLGGHLVCERIIVAEASYEVSTLCESVDICLIAVVILSRSNRRRRRTAAIDLLLGLAVLHELLLAVIGIGFRTLISLSGLLHDLNVRLQSPLGLIVTLGSKEQLHKIPRNALRVESQIHQAMQDLDYVVGLLTSDFAVDLPSFDHLIGEIEHLVVDVASFREGSRLLQ